MLSKRILATALSLTLTATAATGFVGFDTAIFADAAASVQSNTSVNNLVLGKPVIVSNSSNASYRFNFTLDQSGTLEISARNVDNAAFYKSNGVEIDGHVGSNESYKLNADSYYIIVETSSYKNGNGEIMTNFIPSNETFKDSGNGVVTNNTIKLSTKLNSKYVINGFFAKAEYSDDTADSYKVNIPSRSGLMLDFTSPVNDSMVVAIEIYNSKLQRVYINDYVSRYLDGKNYIKLDKGTYYVRVINKYTLSYNGSYRLILKQYNAKKSHTLSVNTTDIKGKSASDSSKYVKATSNDKFSKITYQSSNKKVFTVDKDSGYVSFKGAGKAYLIVTAGSTSKYDAVTKKIPVYVAPKQITDFKTKILSHTDTHSTSKISWATDKSASGYIVKYSTGVTKSGTLVNPKTIKLTSNKKNYFILKDKKIGTKTYFKVCSYKKIGKKVVYGPYSSGRYYKTYKY